MPITIGILLVSEQIYGDASQLINMGELSLDGRVSHLSGVLPMKKLAEQVETSIIQPFDQPEISRTVLSISKPGMK